MAQLVTNNARSTLVAAILSTATSLEVVAGDAAKYPSPTAGDFFDLTLQDATNIEIVRITARVGGVMTIGTRALEGTAAAGFAIGSVAGLRLTAAPTATAINHSGLATGAHAASAISNTAAGGIAALTVQAAINELDTEKVTIGGALGTPTSGVATNLTGTAAGLTSGNVTTNANLTGHVTSVGNAAVLGAFTLAQLNTAVSDADVAILAANTFTAQQKWATALNIASATTVDLNAATTGNRAHITGTVAITAWTLTGGPFTVIFDAATPLTYHATTNRLNSGATSYTATAGDTADIYSDGTTVFVNITKVAGTPVVAGASSALVLLSTVTASAAATADIETTFNSTYDEYLLLCTDMFSSASSGCEVRLKIGGSYLTAGYYSHHIRQRQASTAFDYGSQNNGDRANNVSGGDMSTSATLPACVEFRISKPSINKFQQVGYEGRTVLSGSSVDRSIGGSITNLTQGVLSGIRVYAFSGNISGTFRLYGIANS